MHDPPRQCIVGQVLLVVSVSDDPEFVLGRDVHSLGSPEMGPLPEKFAVGIENLNAIILAVADIHILVGIDSHHMGSVELSRSGAALAPLHQVFAIAGELDHAGVAVAVGDEEIAVG